MDDQLLPFFRDWVMDVMYVNRTLIFILVRFFFLFNFSGEIASKSSSRDLNRAGSEES